MSGVTKLNSSYKKTNYPKQKSAGVGFQHNEFYHQASEGDVIINFNSLVLPVEASSEGFANPSPVTLTSAKLKQNRANLTLHSYRGKWVDRIDYTIQDNAQITLKRPAEDGEVFHGVIHNIIRNTTENPDLQNLVAVGTLAQGQTIFNIGKAYRVNVNPLTQIGEILVFRGNSPVLVLRNTGNAVANVLADGNYHEVASNGGYGTTIEFNDAGAVGGELITVVSTGRLLERPSNSLLQEIETLAGQLDSLIPYVEDLAGLAPNTLQSVPNNADLKTFGDLVLSLLPIKELKVPLTQRFMAPIVGSTNGTTNTFIPHFPTVTINEGDLIGTISTTAALGWSFTALMDCEVSLTFGFGSNQGGAISINALGAELSTAAFSIPAGKIHGYVSPLAAGNVNTSPTVALKTGDVVRVHTQQSAASSTNGNFTMIANASKKISELI